MEAPQAEHFDYELQITGAGPTPTVHNSRFCHYNCLVRSVCLLVIVGGGADEKGGRWRRRQP